MRPIQFLVFDILALLQAGLLLASIYFEPLPAREAWLLGIGAVVVLLLMLRVTRSRAKVSWTILVLLHGFPVALWLAVGINQLLGAPISDLSINLILVEGEDLEDAAISLILTVTGFVLLVSNPISGWTWSKDKSIDQIKSTFD